MKIAGIVAEYNPLHNGHAYHIEQTRTITNADYIIVAMSGDFIQRGGPACLSKHHRSKLALLSGADLVFEIPSTHSCESAELFCRSGIELLHGLGCVDFVSFGSECGDISKLDSLGHLLANEPEEYKQQLGIYLRKGLSFPVARQLALSPFADESVLSSPNNILGIEYCKSIHRLGSPMQPVTIPRAGMGYHDLDLSHQFPSASALRNHYESQGSIAQLESLIPTKAYNYMVEHRIMEGFLRSEDFSLILRYLLVFAGQEQLEQILDISPDLAKKILHYRNQYLTYSQFVQLLKSKDITHSRLTRALFHWMLDIKECPSLPYARLLGFRKTASPVLKEIKKKGQLPLITKLADAPSLLDSSAMQILEHNTRISNLYESVLCEKMNKPFVHEYQKELILLP